MKICAINNITFQRKLKNNEISDYQNTLQQAKYKVGNRGKSLLIVPSTSLPNKTGVGNLGTKESLDFFEFAKNILGNKRNSTASHWSISQSQWRISDLFRHIYGFGRTKY